MDEHVVRRFAEAAGHAPRPLFPSPQGDLLLFTFLCGGILGGWVLGYFYRAVFVETAGRHD